MAGMYCICHCAVLVGEHLDQRTTLNSTLTVISNIPRPAKRSVSILVCRSDLSRMYCSSARCCGVPCPAACVHGHLSREAFAAPPGAGCSWQARCTALPLGLLGGVAPDARAEPTRELFAYTSALMWSKLPEVAGLFFRGGAIYTASLTAAVFGTILSAVNQGSAIVGGTAGVGTWLLVVANYMAMFVVTYVCYLFGRPSCRPDKPVGAAD
jgi:hypothetical protein